MKRNRSSVSCHNASPPEPSNRDVQVFVASELLGREHEASGDEDYGGRLEPFALAIEVASDFYARLSREHGSDVDLDAVIQEGRQSYPGPEL